LTNTAQTASGYSSTQGSGFCGPLALIQAKHMDEILQRGIGTIQNAPRGCRKLELGNASCLIFFCEKLKEMLTFDGPEDIKTQLSYMLQSVEQISAKSKKTPSISFDKWMTSGITCIDPPYFLHGLMKIHLWVCTSESDQTRFICSGTNSHSLLTKHYLPEWRDEILDTNKYGHVYYKQNHYFQVRPYDTVFFQRELSEALECLFANVLTTISCKSCLIGATFGDDGGDTIANDLTI